MALKCLPRWYCWALKGILFLSMGTIKPSLSMFFFLGILGGERVKPLQQMLNALANKPYLFPIFAGSPERLKSWIVLSAQTQTVRILSRGHRRPARAACTRNYCRTPVSGSRTPLVTLKSGFSESHLAGLEDDTTSSRASSRKLSQEGEQMSCLWKDAASAIHPLSNQFVGSFPDPVLAG